MMRAVTAPAAEPTLRAPTLRKLYLFALGLPKTLIFNFRYFPFATAIRLPVFVSHRVWLKDLSGEVTLADQRTGAVKIGFGGIGIFDQERSRAIWQVSGKVEFRGQANIGHGCKLSVEGLLIVGDGATIVAESSVIARRRVHIGDNALISWEVLIMDTDAHSIYDASGRLVNEEMPIRIGNTVWIGCRSLVLKGVEIADGVVIAAGSTLTSSVDLPNAIAGGSPARVIRENIRWTM